MRQEILNILNTYNILKTKPYQPSTQNDAKLITNKLPLSISKNLKLDEKTFKIQGSVGAGKWTDTPWVSVFNLNITDSAQKGFYIVYLFRKDMKGLYLSLNQGTTYIDEKYKGQKPREKMEIIAANIRERLTYDSNVFPIDKIDLVANTKNALNYSAAHICGKYYSFKNMPNEEVLINDLKELIKIYCQFEKLIAGRTVEDTLNYFVQMEEIEDIQFQADILVANPSKTPRKPQPAPEKTNNNGKLTWKRDAKIAKEALEGNNYLCEIDANHTTFISSVTKKNFVEAHHLIPMKLQSNYSSSLDVPGNIVSLCPNCHRKVHHAISIERRKLIKVLYEKRFSDLKDFGIHITLEDLHKAYQN